METSRRITLKRGDITVELIFPQITVENLRRIFKVLVITLLSIHLFCQFTLYRNTLSGGSSQCMAKGRYRRHSLFSSRRRWVQSGWIGALPSSESGRSRSSSIRFEMILQVATFVYNYTIKLHRCYREQAWVARLHLLFLHQLFGRLWLLKGLIHLALRYVNYCNSYNCNAYM